MSRAADALAPALRRPWPLVWTSHQLPGNGHRDDRCMLCDNARYAIRIGRWKLLAWAEPYGCEVPPMRYITDAPLLDADVQLYDVDADLAESVDLARERRDVAARLLRELKRTRAAIQAIGPRWDLSCLLPTGPFGETIVYKPAQRGYCRCARRNATGRTLIDRARLAATAVGPPNRQRGLAAAGRSWISSSCQVVLPSRKISTRTLAPMPAR